MSKRKGVMSDRFKEEIAKELGIYDTVSQEGWGGITAKDAGNMTKLAIQKAQEQMSKDRSL
ncbi:small, acid-soluble spore protein, alpha/beta type [Pontibacillus yanchengensis]|uniref:Small, acid-soluble spore protein, alpha/beta type n=2 Tax=Pontibacillus yanchengensis TaxID=462910 RepID=A0ACC7VMN6_9BACI|nr:small, acid-soluble spore protein, alpha/beta type [Pontibacillus yanchengensis]MYL35944.1 small, acid-soluble spore protein, alpha/beta type [Pontibacillus yanchengensis]MYL55794.1 small, acid-soluble spore protein, alpha/beta type [Pontibacillus yanchengensis]